MHLVTVHPVHHKLGQQGLRIGLFDARQPQRLIPRGLGFPGFAVDDDRIGLSETDHDRDLAEREPEGPGGELDRRPAPVHPDVLEGGRFGEEFGALHLNVGYIF